MARSFNEKLTEEELAEKIWNACGSIKNGYYQDGYLQEMEDTKCWKTQKRAGDCTSYVEKCYIARLPLIYLEGKVEKDLKKVDFDWENYEYSPGETYCDEDDIGGFHTLENGLTYLGVTAGGDWEWPLFFIIYWDGKKLRGYIPKKGNVWNSITKTAYGNDCGEPEDVTDLADIKKKFPNETKEIIDELKEDGVDVVYDPEDDRNLDHFEHLIKFDSCLLEEDILERITYKGE